MVSPRWRRRLRRPHVAALGLLLAASLAGCVSVPSGGPVLSFPITQGPGGQNQPYPQAIAQPPRAGWQPEDIVAGFLAAAASLGAQQHIARDYLTTAGNRAWAPGWSAIVYGNGPTVARAAYTGTGSKEQATVTIGGSVQATLSGNGSYAVPSASAAESARATIRP